MDTDMINETIMREEITDLVIDQFELTSHQATQFIAENIDVITEELWEVFLNSVEFYVNNFKQENGL